MVAIERGGLVLVRPRLIRCEREYTVLCTEYRVLAPERTRTSWHALLGVHSVLCECALTPRSPEESATRCAAQCVGYSA